METKWSVHAKQRTYDRRSHPTVANEILNLIFDKLENRIPNFCTVYTGEITVRSFPDHSYFVVNISSEKETTIYVVTYGDISSFHPKYGERVISILPNNDIEYRVWKKKGEEHQELVLYKEG